jgi:hypothetical protein
VQSFSYMNTQLFHIRWSFERRWFSHIIAFLRCCISNIGSRIYRPTWSSLVSVCDFYWNILQLSSVIQCVLCVWISVTYREKRRKNFVVSGLSWSHLFARQPTCRKLFNCFLIFTFIQEFNPAITDVVLWRRLYQGEGLLPPIPLPHLSFYMS